MRVWFDGRLVGGSRARLDPLDRGFLLGDGCFETLLALDGGVVDFNAHLDRLRRCAELLRITVPYADDVILRAIRSLLAEGDLGGRRAAIRITVSRGPGRRGLAPAASRRPTVCVAVFPAPPRPRRLTLAHSTIRRNPSSPACRFKTLSYLDNVLARREAVEAGADEALLRDTRGAVACAAAGNVFVLEAGELITPRPADGAMEGTARARLLRVATETGLRPREGRIPVSRLERADALLVTNSLIGCVEAGLLDAAPPRTAAARRVAALRRAYARDEREAARRGR